MGEPLYLPLFHATVASYARPFTRNKPFGPLPDKWSRFATERLQKTHDALIDARHTYVAHSDSEVREVQILPPGAAIGSWRSGTLSVMIKTTWWPLDSFDRVIEVCKDLGTRLDDETHALLDELYSGVAGVAISPFKLDPDDEL